MKLHLQWHTDGETHSYTLVEGDTASIGREEDVDIFLYDRRVARRHGEIQLQQGQVILRNTSAKPNPIRLGTQALRQGEETALQDGTTLRFGDTEISTWQESENSTETVRIQCGHCRTQVAYEPKGFCPFCGYALASGHTTFAIERNK